VARHRVHDGLEAVQGPVQSDPQALEPGLLGRPHPQRGPLDSGRVESKALALGGGEAAPGHPGPVDAGSPVGQIDTDPSPAGDRDDRCGFAVRDVDVEIGPVDGGSAVGADAQRHLPGLAAQYAGQHLPDRGAHEDEPGPVGGKGEPVGPGPFHGRQERLIGRRRVVCAAQRQPPQVDRPHRVHRVAPGPRQR
jgi:hypothetical protein